MNTQHWWRNVRKDRSVLVSCWTQVRNCTSGSHNKSWTICTLCWQWIQVRKVSNPALPHLLPSSTDVCSTGSVIGQPTHSSRSDSRSPTRLIWRELTWVLASRDLIVYIEHQISKQYTCPWIGSRLKVLPKGGINYHCCESITIKWLCFSTKHRTTFPSYSKVYHRLPHTEMSLWTPWCSSIRPCTKPMNELWREVEELSLSHLEVTSISLIIMLVT